MRPIKFRAWDGYNIRYDVTGTEHGRDNDVGGVFLDGEYFALSDNSLHPKAELMQFTGLKDKNGVEIYEGDRVVKNEYIWFDDGKPNYIGEVEWVYSQWQVIAKCVNEKKRGISDGMNYGLNDEGFEDGENSDWEVIGNIYDNGNR